MKKSLIRKTWNFLNNKLVIGMGIFVMLSLAMVFAGNVVVKDGSVDVQGTSSADGIRVDSQIYPSTNPDPDNGYSVVLNSGNGGLVYANGSTAPFKLHLQDGHGRVHYLWNVEEHDSDYEYSVSSEGANWFRTGQGKFYFYTAPSGTAGDEISWNTPLFLDDNGKVGIGTTSPGYGLDVEESTGVTFAKFGSSLPVYLTGNNPTVGFNTYFNSGWKFGKGSSSEYAGVLEFIPSSGIFNLKTSSSSGSEDGTANIVSRVSVTQEGDVGIGTTSPNSKLDVDGPISTEVNIVTSTYTVTDSDSVVVAENSYFVIDLPSASNIRGRQYTIKRAWDNTAPGPITVDPYSSQKIDGSSTYSLSSAGDYVMIVSDGSDWVVVGEN